MSEVTIDVPDGWGIPLVDTATYLFGDTIMGALDERYLEPPTPNRLVPVAGIHADVGGYQHTLPDGAPSVVIVPAGSAYARPFIPSRTFSFDRVGFSVTTGNAAVGVRVALFASSVDGRMPGDLILELGVLSFATVGIVEAPAGPVQLEEGVQYWLAVQAEGGDANMRGMNSPTTVRRFANTAADAGNPPAIFCAQWVRAAGGFPAAWGGTTYGGSIIPNVVLRRSA